MAIIATFWKSNRVFSVHRHFLHPLDYDYWIFDPATRAIIDYSGSQTFSTYPNLYKQIYFLNKTKWSSGVYCSHSEKEEELRLLSSYQDHRKTKVRWKGTNGEINTNPWFCERQIQDSYVNKMTFNHYKTLYSPKIGKRSVQNKVSMKTELFG